jgi:hypothetical protein
MATMPTGARAGRDSALLGGLRWRLAQLEDQNAALREELQRLEAERERLRGENERLRAERDRFQATNERLRAEVDALRRAAKRQAAPFSKDDPTPSPKRPDRRPGAAYGTRAHRHPPEHVDQVVEVGLPACCPGCRGELVLERVATQHVEDLPAARPLVTCYQVQVGRCRACGRRVQPRHPGQTSDALGAAGTQLGPRAVALASWLSKGLGMPAGKIARLLGQLGVRITPVGSSRRSRAPPGPCSRPTRPWPEACGPVLWSPPMRPAGGSAGSGRGCGPSSASRSPSTASPAAVATGTPRWSSARITPVCLSATAGRPTTASSTPATRPAWRTCCGAAGS